MSKPEPQNAFPLIDKAILAWLVFGFIVISVLLSFFLISIQAFDQFYEYSRAHEDWDLDEIVLALIASLIALNITALILSSIFRKRLVTMTNQQLELERKLAHGSKLQAMGNLLGGVAHSINNHLVPIQTLTTLVQAELPKDSEEAQDLEKVVAATRNASSILRQILAFSRQEDDQQTQSCPIGKTLSEAVALATTALPSAIRLQQNIQSLTDHVAIHPTHLEVIMLNLINNATDAIGDQAGAIKVSLEACPPPISAAMNGTVAAPPESSWICIKIADSGKGMQEREKQRMFDPFFTTKPVGKGTGLGLSETYGIVSKAGGRIEVASTPGEGTEIAIFLPVHSDSAALRTHSLEITHGKSPAGR